MKNRDFFRVLLPVAVVAAGAFAIFGCAAARFLPAPPAPVGPQETNVAAVLPAGPGQIRFVVLSDLHFNPFLCSNRAYTNLAVEPAKVSWAKTFAAYEADTNTFPDHPGQDTSYHLLRRALQDLTNRCPVPAFVLCCGDFYAHEAQLADELSADPAGFDAFRTSPALQARYVENSEALVARMFRHAGLTNVFPTLGNNDSLGDYVPPSREFLQAFAQAWQVCAPANTFGPEFFDLGGYTAAMPGITGCRILAFNSSLFSNNTWETGDSRRALQWLGDELATNRDRTLLLYHIPPGVNYFSGGGFWHRDLQRAFLGMVAAHHDAIIGSFCGHTHNDEFRLVFTQGQPVHFIHQAPSISPAHGNSPAYQIFTATTSGEMVNYATYYLARFPSRQEAWRMEYAFADFTNAYNAATLAGLFFSDDPAKMRDQFHVTNYAPGLKSSYDAIAGYWHTVRLDTP